MSMQMSSGSKELHEGNAFDKDSILSTSSEAIVSGNLIAACNSEDDLFDEIDRYYEHDLTIFIGFSERKKKNRQG